MSNDKGAERSDRRPYQSEIFKDGPKAPGNYSASIGAEAGGGDGRSRPGRTAADDQHIRLDPPGHAPGWRRPPPDRESPPTSEPTQHVQVPLPQAPRPQEPMVVERRRYPA